MEPAVDRWAYHPREPAKDGHVLVGIDGSGASLRALDHAISQAVRRRVPLEVLHGWPWTRRSPGLGLRGSVGRPLAEAAQALLDRAAERALDQAPGLAVVSTLTSESAATALVRRGGRAALTVLGTRGHGGLTGMLWGSTCQRVAARIRAPLLVVHADAPHWHGDSPRFERYRDLAHRKVFVGVRSGADVDAALFAFEEAVRLGAQLRVLHAWSYPMLAVAPRPVSPVRLQEEVDRWARTQNALPWQVVAELYERFPEVRLRTAATRRDPADALVEASRAADLVVVATHRRRGGFRASLGPVTRALLHHAHCPVALVPVA